MNRPSDPSEKTYVAVDASGTGLVPIATFGDFELLRVLGEGGMSSVWLARLRRQMGFAKIVALKRMHPQMASRDDARQLFVDEARLTASLRHPNIVEVYDCGETDGHLWLSMEFVDGWTLASIVEALSAMGERLPDAVVADLFAQICSALDHAHNATNELGLSHHLVHRDIKPENIIVSRRGVAKLMDFGIVKATTNLHHTTEAGTARGTVLYMSPEQVRAQPLDRRSDLFALGATLAFTLTGEPPFVAPNIPDIMYAIAHGTRDSALQAVGNAAPEFLATFMRATEKDPDARFDDASEMRADLLAIQAQTDAGETLATWILQNGERLESAAAVEAVATGTESLLAVFVETTSDVVPPAESERVGGDRASPPRSVRTPPRGDPNDVATRLQRLPRRRRRALQAQQSPHTQRRLWVSLGAAVLVVGGMGLTLLLRAPNAPAPQRSIAVEDTPRPLSAAEPSLPRHIVPTATPASVRESTPAPTPRATVTPAREPSTPAREQSHMAPEPTGSVQTELEPVVMGSISLNARPWAYIAIDGHDRGKTPKHNVELPVGTHTVVFRCATYETELLIERSVDIHEGMNESIIASCVP